MKAFASILQFQKAFDTDEKCREYLEQQRWNGTPACPFCGSLNVHRFAKNPKKFNCKEKECAKIFSVTVGTVFENTKIPLTKWFLASYILTVHSKGISSLQLATWLDVTQKTAWHLNHRIRETFIDKNPKPLKGIVEADESYVGGKISNKHVSKRKFFSKNDNKTMVFGALEREGKVVAKIMPDTTKETLHTAIKETVEQGSILVTDEHVGYSGIGKDYSHVRVNHSAKQYVRGAGHTNTIEGFWSLLKRQIVGIHHSVSPKHLQRYIDESAFRYNSKAKTQDERFADALANCEGTLSYDELTKIL